MKSNLFDKIMTILSLVLLLAATVFVFTKWGSLPEQIPSHYNFKGQVDAYGGKGALFIPMIAGWLLVGTMAVLGNFPSVWNTGVERTPANEAAVNRIIRDMLDVMQVSIAALMAYLMIAPTMGDNTAISPWFMPTFLVLIFGNLLVMTVRLLRNRCCPSASR